jgi:hypothetical protein
MRRPDTPRSALSQRAKGAHRDAENVHAQISRCLPRKQGGLALQTKSTATARITLQHLHHKHFGRADG